MNTAMDTAMSSLDETLAHELETLSRAGLRRTMRAVERGGGAQITVDGVSAVDFSSNDYLGIANDPRVANVAAAQLMESHATGAAAARLISGTHPAHLELERDLALFKGAEAALLFASGYAANTGTIPAVVGRRDAIYADELNHASLIDGARLSRAETRVFPHRDLNALRAMLKDDAGKFRRRMIVVDGVFSMDGDLFPLDQLVPIARQYGAWTYVDDAHATGALGAHGRGSTEHFGVEGDIDIVMGTLGKAIGTAGAFVSGSATLIDYLANRARAFIFTTAAPPALAAATIEALRIVQDEPWRRDRLIGNALVVRDGLRGIGLTPGGDADGYIIPVVLGDAERTAATGRALCQRGFLVGAVRPPTVPMGRSRLRITVSASHTRDQISGLIEALRTVLG
ncbi:MAG: 8-amino-7-oxononanoate synthase [Gemmatimonadaceae bacterium]